LNSISTNSLRDDPDVQHVPLFCFDENMIEDMWSSFRKRQLSLGPTGAIFVRYQHLYFYPIMALARVNLYVQSFKHLWLMCPVTFGQDQGMRNAWKKAQFGWKPEMPASTWYLELLGLCAFNLLFWTLIYSLGMVDGLLCLFVSNGSAGILHVQILLSHIAMEFCMDSSFSRFGKAKEDSEAVGFYEWQALSTMDIACPSWMNWFHGGLQFQLEHHLFPRVHSKNLPKLIPLVDEIFAKYDIPVVRLGFVKANMVLVKHLAKVGGAVSDKYFKLQAKKLSVQ
jgi:delta8-fatty-acid desaturase